MDHHECSVVVDRVKAWGGQFPDAMVEVWSEHLAKLEFSVTMNALKLIERTETRRPAIATVLETYRTLKLNSDGRPALNPVGLVKCKTCHDTGWEERSDVMTLGGNMADHAVGYCPNGCRPPSYITVPNPTTEERDASARMMGELLAEHRAREADRERRRASMTPEDFIRSEGHDPATHRVSQSGFVLRNVKTARKP